MTTKTKAIPVIDLGDGMSFTLHSFKSKDGDVILGYLFQPGFNKPKTFFSMEKITKLNNGIVSNVDQFKKLYNDGKVAIDNGWTIEFGEVKMTVSDDTETAEDKPATNNGMVNLTDSKTITKPQKNNNISKAEASADEILDSLGF